MSEPHLLLDHWRPFCGEELFRLPESMHASVILRLAALRFRIAPVQGPASAVCMREPHPDSPWHWDGTGTWWR
jgi:hypothetical protein